MSEYSEKTPLQKANYANATKNILVTNLITKGYNVTANDSFRDVATEVGLNSTIVNTSDANATASDIISSKTAYVNGNKITGTAQGTSTTSIPITVLPSFYVEDYGGQYYISVSSGVYVPNKFGTNPSGISLDTCVIVSKPNDWVKLYAGTYSGTTSSVTFSYDTTTNKIVGTNSTSGGVYYVYTLKDAYWQNVYVDFPTTLTSKYLEDCKNYTWQLETQSSTAGQIFEYDVSSYNFYSYQTFTNADVDFTDYNGISYSGRNVLSTDTTLDAPNWSDTGFGFASGNINVQEANTTRNVVNSYITLNNTNDIMVAMKGVVARYYQPNSNLKLANSKLVSLLGVSAGIIKSGETILGVTGTYVGPSTMKSYASETAMNNDIANISSGEVVKVVASNVTTFYVKETTMKKLVKEEDTISPAEYISDVALADDILGN